MDQVSRVLLGMGGASGITPFIARVTPAVICATLYPDGSTQVFSGSGRTGVLAPGTRSNSATVGFSAFNSPQDNLCNAVHGSTDSVFGFMEGFTAFSQANAVTLARYSMNTALFGGSPGCAVARDSGGNIYVVSSLYPDEGGVYLTPCVRKYDSSGTLLWNRMHFKTYPLTNDCFVMGIAVNSSRVILTLVDLSTSASYVLALDPSNGVITSCRRHSSAYPSISSPAVDASNRIYVAANKGTLGDCVLYRYNALATTFDAQKNVTGYEAASYTKGCVAIDPVNGDVYWLLYAGSFNAAILKTDSSLNALWLRTIATNFGTFDYYANIHIVDQAICFVARRSGLVFVLPKDGSRTGTYSVGGLNVTYGSASTPSLVTGSTTDVADSFSGSTQTITTSTPSSTAQAAFTIASISI